LTELHDFPLKSRTPPAWAPLALADPLALLADQAYLEKKAANNALEFLNLWSSGEAPDRWLTSVAAIAKDETQHLAMVLKLLEKRGGTLPRTHKNPYALALQQLVRKGKGPEELADRLLVSALIEARSCERFERLAETSDDAELSRFFSSLVKSESGHYRIFIEMAKKIVAGEKVSARWRQLAEKEAEIIETQPVGSRVHGGYK
jgi:tRNA-(ms[2]io[6]A)-hydroxylase